MHPLRLQWPRKRGAVLKHPEPQDAPAKRTPAGSGSAGSNAGKSALWRLSCLPPELQDAVIGHLPLVDVLVWQRLNRNFCHRVKVAGMRERAVCRSLGLAFPHKVLTRAHYAQLLQPWLAGFSANPLGRDRPGAHWCRPVLFCALSRALYSSQRLALVKKASFRLPGTCTARVEFSPAGNFLAVTTTTAAWPGSLRVHVLSRDTAGWHRGSPFVGEQGALALCFAADEQRVAVVEDRKQVRIWDRSPAVSWHQTARVTPERWIAGARVDLLFSPDASSLVVHGAHGFLTILGTDHRHGWQICQQFATGYLCPLRKTVFSPDGRWLLVYTRFERFTLYGRNAQGQWAVHPPLEFREHGLPARAFFRPGSQWLALLIPDRALSLWQLRAGGWREQVVISHPYGITEAWFSPDGLNLVTRCSLSGVLLWQQDARGVWRVLHRINADPEGLSNVTHVYFDPASRWLIAGGEFDPVGPYGSTLEMWAKDNTGWWRAASDVNGSDLVVAHGLAVSRDGRHLASLGLSLPQDEEQTHDALRLLELRGGRWVTRAEYPVPFFRYRAVAMDPFCCHLAAVWSGEPVVELLRVQEASDT